MIVEILISKITNTIFDFSLIIDKQIRLILIYNKVYKTI